MSALDILYVDDDPDIRHIVALALGRDPSLTVRYAATGEEAMAMLSAGPSPDVVLADVMMPGMDGPALLDAMRADVRTSDVPVIFVTARAREADRQAYRARGAIGVIVKPFDLLALPQTVREQLARAR